MATPREEFGAIVGSDMRNVERKTEPIDTFDDERFAVTDREGKAAFVVQPDGSVSLGDSKIVASDPAFRVMDQDGNVAFEVRPDGSVHIPSLQPGGDPPPPVPDIVEVDTLHVFIAAGQSNMSGRGLPVEGPQSPRIMQFGANRRVIEQAPLQLDMVDSPSGTSPALFFADNYLASQPDHVGVLLVPAARGGTAFVGSPEAPVTTLTWTKGSATSPTNALYERSVAQALDALAAAKAAGYHPILKGVLWHQGESNDTTAAATYQARLDELISNYRTDLESPRLPFIAGRMVPEWVAGGASRQQIDDIHYATPLRTPFTGVADSAKEAFNVGDQIHFSTVGTRHLGDTYLAGYIQALGNTHGGH